MFASSYGAETWIPYLMVLGDLLKGVAWPVAALAIALKFSSEIKGLLLRIRRFGPSGVEIEQLAQDNLDPKQREVRELSAPQIVELTDPVARNLEESNRAALENFSRERREDVLLRSLTVQQLGKYFALAYANIFGSQIRLLREMNVRTLTREEVGAFFRGVRDENPSLATWDLDGYLNYLLFWSLLEEKDGKYQVTETGRNFLQFLTENRLSEVRAH